MKKLFVITLLVIAALLVVGCNKKETTLKDAVKIYGENYQVVELDSTHFLIKWENASMIFKNNKVLKVLSVK